VCVVSVVSIADGMSKMCWLHVKIDGIA